MRTVNHPGFSGPIRASSTVLSDDPDEAVAQTIEVMGRYAVEDSRDPAIGALAAQLRGATDRQTIANIWNWIRARLQFVDDSVIGERAGLGSIHELLIRPADIVHMQPAQGDCDDFSMLGAALLTACNIPAQFVTVAAAPEAPNEYTHVYLLADGTPFDSSHGQWIGWEVPNTFNKRQEWGLNGVPMERVHRRMGLSGLGADFHVEGTAPAPQWWEGLLGAGIDIAKARYGVPPENTVIQTAGGTVQRLSYPGVGVNVTSSGFPSFPSWIWIAGLALVALLFLGGRRR